MSTVPQFPSDQPIATLPRATSIMMGRLDYLSVLLRLIGTELYRLRRRAMSKVLVTISIIAMLLVFGVVSLATVFIVSTSPKTFYCSSLSNTGNQNTQACLNSQLTPEQQAQATSERQSALRAASDPLRLPNSLNFAVAVARTLGLMLIIILTGVIVGGEYAIGTIRLNFTRGPSRTQFFLAKIGAIILCTVLGFLMMLVIGIVAGTLLNLISGIAIDAAFFNAAWLGHALLFVLEALFGLFVYAMMALFIATLGRSTAAGVAAALVWSLLEPIIGTALSLLGSSIHNGIGDFLKAIPDYFIGNNISALLGHQLPYLEYPQTTGTPGSITDAHALLVLAVYLVLFIGLSWWVNERRDVTN